MTKLNFTADDLEAGLACAQEMHSFWRAACMAEGNMEQLKGETPELYVGHTAEDGTTIECVMRKYKEKDECVDN